MFLSESLHNRHNNIIFKRTSSYLGENTQIARSSGPSNQAAMRKHHQSIIIISQSLLDLIESLSQSRTSLRKQRRLGWSSLSTQFSIKLRSTVSLLTWHHHYGRGSGWRDCLSSQSLSRSSLDVVEHWKGSSHIWWILPCASFDSRKGHSGLTCRDLDRLRLTTSFETTSRRLRSIHCHASVLTTVGEIDPLLIRIIYWLYLVC